MKRRKATREENAHAIELMKQWHKEINEGRHTPLHDALSKLFADHGVEFELCALKEWDAYMAVFPEVRPTDPGESLEELSRRFASNRLEFEVEGYLFTTGDPNCIGDGWLSVDMYETGEMPVLDED